MVAAIARELLAMGERPTILTRGYARTRAEDGVVVVRDPDGMRADLARAGDEPLMLARSLPGASVLVSSDRYLAGRLAEHQFNPSVHILDDGFQHLQLDRDVDIVMLGHDDVAHPVTLPGGRLREPLDTLVAADAIVAADDDVVVDAAGWDVPVFRTRRVVTESVSRGCRPRPSPALPTRRVFSTTCARSAPSWWVRSPSGITTRTPGEISTGSARRPDRLAPSSP